MLYQFLVLTGNWQFFCCDGKFSLQMEKKDTVVCLAGARSITTGKKIDTVVCLLGAPFWQLQPEKKDTVVCLAGAQSITTGKKKIQSSVVGCAVMAIMTGKKNGAPNRQTTVSFFFRS